ncbi:MAG: hypothetical protein IPG60_03680 [Bacteroidetes bacterium]|nr:hypothetical protein [Bacteroidota bacterium]MBP7399269.1 hypothetical protein [Chitinophagales bacterium]MBK7108581.1 hypothetical protein [Bacteroidota bacterium]MBK8489094.1 hypothetical protein [Bacteroidota bacterium]MBK8680943.1 hypothetical protein [Bacteroidota bacterium]
MVALNEIPIDGKTNSEKVSMHIEHMEHLRSRQEVNESRFIEFVSWLIVLGVIAGIIYFIVNFDKIFS